MILIQATITIPNHLFVGNSANQGNLVDGSTGSAFVLEDSFTAAARLTTWALWSWENRWITPLLLENMAGNYILRGVGEARLPAAGQGAHTYDFNLQSGNNTVSPGFYFGWADADVDPATGTPANGNGVIQFKNDGGTFHRPVRWFGGNQGAGTYLPGHDFGTGTAFNRNYAVQAVAFVATVKGTAIVVK